MKSTHTTLKDWLHQARASLSDRGYLHPMQESLSLMMHTLGQSKEQILMHDQCRLSLSELKRLDERLEQRLNGVPLGYLNGFTEFWSLPFHVSPATLIPRSDTELLVQCALQQGSINGVYLELGTGSGAVVCALAKGHPESCFIATDVSAEALAIAQQNVHNLRLSNVHLYLGDWWSAVPDQRFGLICSNPPYLSRAELAMLSETLCFEPEQALLGGVHGTEMLHQVIAGAPYYLVEGGMLILEHGARQATTVRELLRLYGYGEIFTCQDLGGRDRVTMGRCISPR